MLKAFLERRRLKKTLGRYLSPDMARLLGDDSLKSPAANLTERGIEVAFITVSALDAPSYSERAGIVADLALQHDGYVQSLLPVIVVAFGCIQATSPDARLRFIADVQSRLPDAIIVHGSIAATVGSFGSSKRLDFGFWWPGAPDALRRLAALAAGTVHELRPDERNG